MSEVGCRVPRLASVSHEENSEERELLELCNGGEVVSGFELPSVDGRSPLISPGVLQCCFDPKVDQQASP